MFFSLDDRLVPRPRDTRIAATDLADILKHPNPRMETLHLPSLMGKYN